MCELRPVSILSVLFLVTYPAYSAQWKCSGENGRKQTLVNCSQRGLSVFPVWSGDNITDLSLSSNQLPTLGEQSLSGLGHLRHLNLSHNLLSHIDERAFLSLKELQTLDLSYNLLRNLSSITFRGLSSLVSLRLDHNHLSVVPEGMFQGLVHLGRLDLTGNKLQVLFNGTFQRLPQLQWLEVGGNELYRLEAGALVGLGNLTYLDLSMNELQLTRFAFPPGVFSQVRGLRVLHVEGNDGRKIGYYPEGVFGDLKSLRYLAIDTFSHGKFGQEFSALRNIHTLDLTVNCKLRHLTNSSLKGFRNSSLSFLHLHFCPLFAIDACTLCEMPALQRLWIEDSHYLNPLQVLAALYGVQGQTMAEIRLVAVGYSLPYYHTIDSHSGQYLRSICVSSLAIVNSHIQRISGNALTVPGTPFFRCLEHVDFSRNSLIGDSSALVKLLTTQQRLRTFSITDQQTLELSGALCIMTQHFRCHDHHFVFRGWGPYSLSSSLPPNLTFVNISSLFPHLNPLPANWTLTPASRLKTLDLSYLGFGDCRTTLYGLEMLETLRLDGNYCYNMSENVFDFLRGLKRLSLSNLGINREFFLSRGWRLFQNLDLLEELDLSLMNLIFVDPQMLHAQRRLKVLDFSGNRLQAVPVQLENHGDLRLLDLSRNMLTTLSLAERDAFDSMAGQHPISIRLQDNPLECACYNLDFVQWLWETSVTLDGTRHAANFTCSTTTGEVTSTEQVMAQWLVHWRGCFGAQLLTFALSAFFTQILGLALAFTVAHLWTQLCFAWKSLRHGFKLPRREQFQSDAYVVYADVEDDVCLACVTLPRCLEEQFNVRLLLRDRDELPGSVRAESIVQHINDSWKVLLLVTEAFSKDEWACGFTVQQAQRAISDTMPERVVIVFLEPPSRLQAMPSLDALLRMVPEKNVFHMHRRGHRHRHVPPARCEVWAALAAAVLKDNN